MEKTVLKVDPSKEGLRKVLKKHEAIALECVWEMEPEPQASREVYLYTNKMLAEDGESISRATIINFLNEMVDEGVLKVNMVTCKGGTKGLYAPVLDREDFIRKVIRETNESFHRDWSHLTRAKV